MGNKQALPYVKAAIKQGNGLAVRIPYEIAKHFSIKPGDLVVILIEPVGKIDSRDADFRNDESDE